MIHDRPRAAVGTFPYPHRTLAQVEQDERLVAHDFNATDRAIIHDRRQFQSATELAAVFNTTPAVIGAICRQERKA